MMLLDENMTPQNITWQNRTGHNRTGQDGTGILIKIVYEANLGIDWYEPVMIVEAYEDYEKGGNSIA